MNLIIDTNIIFSALYSESSSAAHLLDMAILGEVKLFSPLHVKHELERILKKKLGYSNEELIDLFENLPLTWLEEELYEDKLKYASKLIKDKNDVPILSCAMATDYPIVTGDKHFFKLKHSKIKVLKLKDLK